MAATPGWFCTLTLGALRTSAHTPGLALCDAQGPACSLGLVVPQLLVPVLRVTFLLCILEGGQRLVARPVPPRRLLRALRRPGAPAVPGAPFTLGPGRGSLLAGVGRVPVCAVAPGLALGHLLRGAAPVVPPAAVGPRAVATLTPGLLAAAAARPHPLLPRT